MVEMRVAGIALDAASRSPIVLLRDPSGRRQVPIWIDQAQAQNILAGLGGTTPPRPLSHDLMASLMAVGGVSLERVIIHSIEDATFRAVLKLTDSDGEASELDCRPSDAIALALRTGSGIWMLEEVVADASIPVDSEADAEEKADFRRFLDQVSPAELIRNLSRAQRQDNPESDNPDSRDDGGGDDDSGDDEPGPGAADNGSGNGPMDEPPAPSSSNS
jgi:bifunctional DNase/RNase